MITPEINYTKFDGARADLSEARGGSEKDCSANM
ncbi:hypothetical protein [Mesorhizobium sp.]